MVSLSDLQSMDPYEFEELVGKVWDEKGYETEVLPPSNDKAIDVVATTGNHKILIQAKRWGNDNKVGGPDVRYYSTLYRQEPDADQVIIVTTSSFTSQAKELGAELNVQLVNGHRFVDMVNEYNISLYNSNSSQRTASSRPSQKAAPSRASQKNTEKDAERKTKLKRSGGFELARIKNAETKPTQQKPEEFEESEESELGPHAKTVIQAFRISGGIILTTIFVPVGLFVVVLCILFILFIVASTAFVLQLLVDSVIFWEKLSTYSQSGGLSRFGQLTWGASILFWTAVVVYQRLSDSDKSHSSESLESVGLGGQD